MRIYDGSPRQDFEEVLRSIGAFLDQRGMRDVLLLEAPDGFIVQGLVIEGGSGTWSEAVGHQVKETLTFLDDDIARFMDEASGAARRAGAGLAKAGYYESRSAFSALDGRQRRTTSSSSSRRAPSACRRSGRPVHATPRPSSRRTTSRR
jgi:hypothetical protein